MGENAAEGRSSGTEQSTYDFTASAHRGSSQRDSDVVDADIVEDEGDVAAAGGVDSVIVDDDAPGKTFSYVRNLDEMVHEGELIDADEASVDEVIIEGEVVEFGELMAGRRRLALTAQQSQQIARNTATKTRQARVNQHYNEVDTGGILGIGSDDAAPLQDPGYQLG